MFGCSFGGFQPPPPHYHWQLHNEKVLFPNSDPNVLTKYLARRKKTCRIAVWILVTGESVNPEENLCLEKKVGILKVVQFVKKD